MNRRTFLGVVTAGVTTLAGCSESSSSPETESPSSPITDRQFRLVDPNKRFNSSSYDRDKRFQHAAEVQFATETNRIIVVGRLKSGGRSCRDTVLQSTTYDRASDTLTVVVFDDFDESANACTTEIAVVPYEATVSFDSRLSEKVVVKHQTDKEETVFEENSNTVENRVRLP